MHEEYKMSLPLAADMIGDSVTERQFKTGLANTLDFIADFYTKSNAQLNSISSNANIDIGRLQNTVTQNALTFNNMIDELSQSVLAAGGGAKAYALKTNLPASSTANTLAYVSNDTSANNGMYSFNGTSWVPFADKWASENRVQEIIGGKVPLIFPSQNPGGAGRNWFDATVPAVTNFIDNVFHVQNKSKGQLGDGSWIYGNAAIAFLDANGSEMGAVGYSRNNLIQPNGYYADTMYIECGNFQGKPGNPSDFRLICTLSASDPTFPGTSFNIFHHQSMLGATTIRSRGGEDIVLDPTVSTGRVKTLGTLTVGDVGDVRKFEVGMLTTKARFREKDAANQFALSTNYSNHESGLALVPDDVSKSVWVQSMGGGMDIWQLQRADVGSTTLIESVRVDAAGRLLIGQTTTGPAFDGNLSVSSGTKTPITARSTSVLPSAIFSNTGTGDTNLVFFGSGATYSAPKGIISYNSAANVVAYGTTSDYRAKTVHGPIENAVDLLMSLNPYTGRMNGASIDMQFFVAHELQEVIPAAVTGIKDAADDDGAPIYQQVDNSFVIPILTAGFQTLVNRVAALEAARA